MAVGENGTLESILLNPMIGDTNFRGLSSVRATRGDDTDGNSSLATSVTNSTFTSTVVTATTRGDASTTVHVRRILPNDNDNRSVVEPSDEFEVSTPSRRGRSVFANDDIILNRSPEEPRSRSQSPLTVNTHASETLSMASASTVGTSIRSSVAVAPRHPGSFGRYANATNTRAMPSSHHVTTGGIGSVLSSSEARPLPDRVVSFTPELQIQTNGGLVGHHHSEAHHRPRHHEHHDQPYDSVEAADSITVPEEVDTFSEVVDNFATSARVWREEYEARLDALHKRWSNE